MEPFRAGQKGSSAMPHKRNPILSERIAGLARLLRGYAQTGFEDQPLWHERDISHSSAERVALPDATILLDYMLVRATGLVDGPRRPAGADAREHRARPRPPRVVAGAARARGARRAVARGRVRASSSATPCGPRTSACRCSACSSTDPVVAQKLPLAELDACFDDATLLRHVPEVIARLDAPGGRPCGSLRRSSAPARSATCTGSTTTGCCSSRPTGCRRSTSSCPRPIPDKGRVLTGLSRFWFARTGAIVPNHLLSTDPADVPDDITDGDPDVVETLRGRMMLGRLAEVLPIECVVRGYLSGSGWTDYLDDGAVCGIPLPPGLRESDRLPAPIFTPATKAPMGEHDENIPFESVETLIGPELAARVRETSLALYAHGAEACERAGIILADTKFEFGAAAVGRAAPDRRGHDARLVALLGRRRPTIPAAAQASFDKQYVRDWLLQQDWDRTRARPGAPARRRRRDPRPLRRRLRADHRRQLRPLSHGGRDRPMSQPVRAYRFAVNVTPKPGILDPQGRAVERSLPHLGIDGVADVRVGRRVELTVTAADEAAARAVVERLAGELLSNPLIEAFEVEGSATRRQRGAAGRGGAGRPVDRAHRHRPVPGLQPGHRRGQRRHARRRGARDPVARGGGPRRRRRRAAAGRLRVRRLPPGRRDRPVQPGDARRGRLRGPRRPGARDLQRLPGARRGGPRARGAAAQPRPPVRVPRGHAAARAPRHAVHARARRLARCGCRSRTARAATTPTRRPSTRWSATGGVLWRYANADGSVAGPTTRATRTARCAGSRACATPRATWPA